ncbi:DUF3515 domain-containing protein [Streptomyces sp. H27-D2]|uniref:DUF3515 domain-containing protein n=1 Tax=Streptomyces sp. H27-D2 TaxID=3046304 RepID=UPI002DBBEC70|nr:DUF3515 domain-containing protein [Streptomyces sp. H27-D2]MEC4017281.1 DUF3515 domain-containing protein [Streptomyces sp. H27-D2]
MTFEPHRPFRCLPVVAVLFAAIGCSSTDDAAGPTVPTPSARAAGFCRALHKELPKSVDGLKRRTADPVSDFTAIWGDPAVRLRCGMPRPGVLTPGNEHYNADVDGAEVNGVGWVLEKRPDGYRFTTTLRKTYVEVTVPGKYAPEIDVLTDLAAAVKKTVPFGL